MTPFNARVTGDATYTVPHWEGVAEFYAFGGNVTIDGVAIVDLSQPVQVGPLVAGAGAVISTGSNSAGLSGYLKNAE